MLDMGVVETHPDIPHNRLGIPGCGGSRGRGYCLGAGGGAWAEVLGGNTRRPPGAEVVLVLRAVVLGANGSRKANRSRKE
jgi:hypothetical protein